MINGFGEKDRIKIRKLKYPNINLPVPNGSLSGTGGCFNFMKKYKIKAQNNQPDQPKIKEVSKYASSKPSVPRIKSNAKETTAIL